jgi:chromate reductase, NAD(P)H dehydrogenase (quinone)
MTQHILIVPGSLRTNSSSHKLIATVTSFFPENFTYSVFEELGAIPAFNDVEEPSESVMRWREKIAASNGVVFITPEYAFGVPGSLKNSLDWTVSSGELVNKSTAVITASTGGEHAHRSLLLTLGALTASPAPGCELLISFIRSKLDNEGKVNDKQLLQRITDLVHSFVTAVEKVS